MAEDTPSGSLHSALKSQLRNRWFWRSGRDDRARAVFTSRKHQSRSPMRSAVAVARQSCPLRRLSFRGRRLFFERLQFCLRLALYSFSSFFILLHPTLNLRIELVDFFLEIIFSLGTGPAMLFLQLRKVRLHCVD